MLLIFAAAWLLAGALGAAVMRRRGHDTFAWAVLFLAFGPLAISSDRHRPPEPQVPSHDGSCDLLIDFDGSAQQAEAVEAALKILGGRVTSVTVACTLDWEAATTVRGREAQQQATERLEAFAARLRAMTEAPVDTVVLYGRPKCTIPPFAAEHGYELILAGNQTTNGLPRAGAWLALVP
jgi:nucleotide-binding universal stress UspA family protein